ncbi:MAG TPA: SDR family oxidoreductase [Bryobacteraceae bacterium]|nr:SDR family oxidoreductase [Bryobacteraceae bacterium]
MHGLALVTGASSGIGAAFASALAARGYDLILVARREDRLKELARLLEKSRGGMQVEALAADLTRDTDLARVEHRIASASNLDLLVNNAGIGSRGKFFEADLARQDEMHRLHVLATLRLTHAALSGMVPRATGAIINVSSVAGFWQAPGNVSYCATKCWMNSFTEGLALELAGMRSPVKVQALCPGYTRSEFHTAARLRPERISANMWMSAEEVVAASLHGLDRGQTFVIPGWRYKAATFLLKHMPRFILRGAAVRQQRRLGRL